MSVFFLTLLRHHADSVILSRKDSFLWKQEYTNILQYSQRQLRRIIQTYSGHSFAALRTELRMKKARDLLTTTDLPVQKIADAVGYTNLNAFYKAFAKFTNISPMEMRKASAQPLI